MTSDDVRRLNRMQRERAQRTARLWVAVNTLLLMELAVALWLTFRG